MKLRRSATATVVLCAALGGWASAADNAPSQPQQQGGIAYISGGVGDEDAQRMKQLRAEYPLELMFVARGNPNQYLSAVKVQIADRSGKAVLDTVSDGPFLLAKVPPGRYTITADSEGSTKRQTVQVGGKTQRVTFVWPPIEAQPPPK